MGRIKALTGSFFGRLSALYILTFASLSWMGISIALPWMFLLAVLLVGIPYAYCITRGLLLMSRLSTHRSWHLCLCMVLGILLVLLFPVLYEPPLVLPILFATLIILESRNLQRGFVQSVISSLVAIALLYGTVWHLNYILGLATSARLHDPAMLKIDVSIYEWIFSRPVDYRGMFPIFRSFFLFRLLENAYQMLFVELFVVILILFQQKRNPTYFLRSVFVCYLLGLFIFFLYPVVGPSIYYPDSMHPNYHGTKTYDLMQGMASEYEAVVNRKAGSNGFAYFVALPSLHVAMAVIFQIFLYCSQVYFWTFFASKYSDGIKHCLARLSLFD